MDEGIMNKPFKLNKKELKIFKDYLKLVDKINSLEPAGQGYLELKEKLQKKINIKLEQIKEILID